MKLKNLLAIILSLTSLYLGSFDLKAQESFRILHYTEISGFDHQTRSNSLAMFEDIGAKNDFSVTDDQTGTHFNSYDTLKKFAVIVFSNTSGNAILDSAQRANFEKYIDSGGALLGIHAASDTYRHSSANGSGTGKWDFYAELLGASVQRNPNHVSGTPSYDISKLENHPTTEGIPETWTKEEEYYYWENGYFDTANNVVLEVEKTGQDSYDSARPVSWYKELSNGARSFYTSLGHANNDYTGDTLFQKHIRNAVMWAAHKKDSNPTSFQKDNEKKTLTVYPNPVREQMIIQLQSSAERGFLLKIRNMSGKVVKKMRLTNPGNKFQVSVQDLPVGIYTLSLENNKFYQRKKVVIGGRD